MMVLKKIINKLKLIKYNKIDVWYNKKENQLIINNELNVGVKIKGDLTIYVDGELNLITKNHKMCLDSINSKIYLNSKAGKIFNSSQTKLEAIE